MKTCLTILCLVSVLGCGRSAPPQIIVEIDPTGHVRLEDVLVTKKQLRDVFMAKYRKHGQCPVLIRAANDTRHSDVHTVMDIALSVGLWRLAFSDDTGAVAQFPNYLHGWEPEVTEDGETVPKGSILISVSGQGVNTASLANASSSTKVAILCTSDSRHADLMAALGQCEAMNISTVFVGTVWAKRTAEPAPGPVPSKAAADGDL